MKIFIAGSVNAKIKKKYLEGIKEIGEYLIKNNHDIICVGAATGSIGEMYNTYVENNGNVDIIVPLPYAHEAEGMKANSITKVDTLYMLQQIALRNTEATIVLPGGNGTLAELYMITDSIKSKFDTDLVLIYNVNGFYDRILEMNNFMMKSGTLDQDQYEFFTFCNTAEELIKHIEKLDKKLKSKK